MLTTFGVLKEGVQRSMLVFCKAQQQFTLFVENTSAIRRAYLLALCLLPPSPHLPVQVSRSVTGDTVLLIAPLDLAFSPSTASLV